MKRKGSGREAIFFAASACGREDAGELTNGLEAAPAGKQAMATMKNPNKATCTVQEVTGNSAENTQDQAQKKPEKTAFDNSGTGYGVMLDYVTKMAKGCGRIETNLDGIVAKLRHENARRDATLDALDSKIEDVKADIPRNVANAFSDNTSRAKHAMNEVADKIETVGGRVLAMLETKLREFEAMELSDYLPPMWAVKLTLALTIGNSIMLFCVMKALKLI